MMRMHEPRLLGFWAPEKRAGLEVWKRFPRHLPFALGPEPDWEREPRAPVAFALAGRCAPPIRIATAPDGSFLALDGGLYGDDGVAPTPDALLDRCLQVGEQALKDIAFIGFLAYWNQSARRLTLMRDDVGACPGYFARYHGGLAFASELSTPLALGIGADADPVALDVFLSLGYFPAPMTPLRGVEKLQPGYSLVVSPGGPEPPRFRGARAPARARPASAGRDAAAHFRESFETALRRRWPSSGRAGLLLSGGVDSALLLAGIRRILQGDVLTFTFEYTGYQGRLNEAGRARRIAAELDAPHETIIVSPERLWSDLDAAVRAYGEPLMWGLHSYRLEPLASAGVTTLFSGAGPDGWNLPRRHRLALRFGNLPPPLRALTRLGVRASAPFLPQRTQSTLRRATREVSDLADIFAPHDTRAGALRASLYRDPDLLDRARTTALDVIRRSLEDFAGETPERRLILLGKRFTTAESILFWNTAWSRALGLALQLPYFDRDLVEVAMDPRRGDGGKNDVRRLVAEFLPAEVAYAPKIPQEIPVGSWLRGPLADRARDRLEQLPARMMEIVDPVRVRGVLAEHISGRADRGWILVGLLTMASWLEQHASTFSVSVPARRH